MTEARINRKIQKANRMVNRGELREAADLCEHMLAAQPNEVQAAVLLSKIRQQTGDLQGMMTAAELAVSARPRSVFARLRLAECLLVTGRTAEAIETVRQVESAAERRPGALLRVAEFFVHCGQHEDANRCQLKAIELRPDDVETLYAAASSCLALGQMDKAEKLYNHLIYLQPDDHDAWYNRSTLRRQTAEENHIDQLEFVRDNLAPDDPGRVPVSYALAKELEDTGRHEKAFLYLRQGAMARRKRLSYDVAADEDSARQIETVFDENFLGQTGDGHASAKPIFILGLPRSGTTLVDRIVSSHSSVASLGEINSLAFAVMNGVDGAPDRSELVQRSAQMDFEAMGQEYVQSIEGFGKEEARLVDKTPLNYLYLGLLHRALPDAKVIHLRRHPLDSCFAMYKTLFRMGYPFSYSLQDVGRYYIAYYRLMEHWRKHIPDYFLDVDYEALVTDPEPQIRRILEFLDLEWEPACLNFHEQTTPSATASAAQVRQPMYQSSVGRWMVHEEVLAPLAAKLREHGIPLS